MKVLAKKLDVIVNDFMNKNVSEETKHDFIIAAIHFNINLNACSEYDLMRIDHKAKELAHVERNELLTTASIYSYILFRAINRNEVPQEEVLNVKESLIEISTIITDYMTYRIDENTMNMGLFNVIKEVV